MLVPDCIRLKPGKPMEFLWVRDLSRYRFMLTFCKSGNSLIRSSVPIRKNGRPLFTSGRYAINLHLIAFYDVVSRVNMGESNKKTINKKDTKKIKQILKLYSCLYEASVSIILFRVAQGCRL